MADRKLILDYGLPEYAPLVHGQPENTSPHPTSEMLIGLGLFLMICLVLWNAVGPGNAVITHNRMTDDRAKLAKIATALNNFYTDMRRFPTAQEGLNILVVTTPARFPYIDTENSNPLIDTWGHPIIYIPPGNGKGEIRSCGRDGIPGTADDVVISLEASPPNP